MILNSWLKNVRIFILKIVFQKNIVKLFLITADRSLRCLSLRYSIIMVLQLTVFSIRMSNRNWRNVLMKLPGINRIFPLILTILLIPGMLAVPAMADELEFASWINVLNYGTSSKGGNEFELTESGQLVTYDLPQNFMVFGVDVVLYSTKPITGAYFSRYGDTHHYTATISDLGNGYYRLQATTGNIFYYFGLTLEYSDGGNALVQILKLRLNIRDSLGFYLPAEGHVHIDYKTSQGEYITLNSGLYKTATSQPSNFVTLGIANYQTEFRSDIIISNYENKDKVYLHLWVKCNNLASIAVQSGGITPVPFEKSVICVTTSNLNPIYMVDIVIDLSDAGPSSNLWVSLSGTTTPADQSYLVIQQLGGYVEAGLPSYDVYWYESILDGIVVGFDSVGSLISAQTSSLVSWLTQINTSLAIGFDGVSTWLSYVHDSIGSGFSNVSTWISNQTFSISTLVSGWGQKIVDAINPPADTDDMRNEVEDIRDQMQDANDVMNELQRPDIDDVFHEVQLDIGTGSPFADIMSGLFANDFIVTIVTGSLAFTLFGILVG